jgi:meso-butanediol dehydrogenase/(S,S)-butanediol dehydrogenase/diacetyl reductase
VTIANKPVRPVFDFTGNGILVTGGTSGMGQAIAESFAASGANVIITGRNEGRGDAVCAAMAAYGNLTAFRAGDISDSTFCGELVEFARKSLGRLDIVVNSAGIIYHATVDETSDEQWLDTFNVNVNGMFYVCRASVPALRERGGVIINIASDAGLSGSRHLVAYCASKGAVVQMSRAMALDHAGEGIRVVALCPGDVDTAMLRGEFAQRGIEINAGLRDSAQGVPVNRVCTVEEVADLALFAASDSARFMTGYPLVLDGGSRA